MFTRRSSTIDKYRAGYLEWLHTSSVDLLFAIPRNKEEVIEGLAMTSALLLYAAIMVTFPVSVPLVTLIKMLRFKKHVRETYLRGAK